MAQGGAALSAFRVLRFVLVVGSTLGPIHLTCSYANYYTTQKYIDLARAPETAAQYSRPLYDALFPTVPYCSKKIQDGYDAALWLIGGRAIARCLRALLASAPGGDNYDCERYAVVFFMHHLFMCAAQVVTTLPASAGVDECYDANPGSRETGVLDWPWYGISFLTQSFAGGRACSDMLYSGHTAVAVLSIVCGARADLKRDVVSVYYVLSFVLCVFCFGSLIACHDHYSVDVVLAAPIAVLLCTNPHIDRWGRVVASNFRSAELAIAGENKRA